MSEQQRENLAAAAWVFAVATLVFLTVSAVVVMAL
jgi:hypothetical protein